MTRRTPDNMARAPRAWQRMLSGRRLDLLNPDPRDVDIGDIAHGLARVARWNGQTRGCHAFSVAQHSLLVEDIVGLLEPDAERTLRVAALLHDAPEYVVGDLISPFKAAIGLDYKTFENKLLAAILARFGITCPLSQRCLGIIKEADRISAYIEATTLAGFSLVEARQFFGEPRALDRRETERLSDITPLPPNQAQHRFIVRFEELAECPR